jgi:L-histidine N-alpha-methyltransferase
MIRETLPLMEQRLRISVPPVSAAVPSFADDVRRGLTASPKVLFPRYLYDALGSRLFEAICELPEYYPTRAETEIFTRDAAEIIAEVTREKGEPVRLVELGSGDGRKTRLLIEALVDRQGALRYLPIDVSRSALEQSAEQLLQTFPDLSVSAFVADYQTGLRALRREPVMAGTRTLALFLGSTIGNLDPGDRVELLREIRDVLRPGDSLLLGVDLRKSPEILLPAYDDALGVTAAFNLNILLRINQELGGGFDLAAFRHRAVWNDEMSRIEMHLESRTEQTVTIRSLGLEVHFAAGETIHTESSYKLDLGQVEAMAAAGGFAVRRTWTDGRGWFISSLLGAV